MVGVEEPHSGLMQAVCRLEDCLWLGQLRIIADLKKRSNDCGRSRGAWYWADADSCQLEDSLLFRRFEEKVPTPLWLE